MALIKADRVKESSTSTGASTFLLNGAFTGFRAFSSVCSVGDTFYYVIDSDLGSEWEAGLGTYSAVNTLTRTTVHSSSNGGSVVTFSAGTKNVYISLTGNQLGTLATLAGSEVLTNKTINASNNTITNVSLTTGVTGTLPLANGGTGTTTAQLAINALAGAVTSGSYLRGNGTNVVMATIASGDVPTLNQNTTGTASGSVSGTASYVPKFTSTNVVGNSLIYDSGTNVGIGTASPADKLHVYKSGDASAKIEGTTSAVVNFTKNAVYCGYVGAGSPGNNDIYIYNLASGAVRINAQAVYVTATNLVGINETIPGAQLQVTSAAAATKGMIVRGASAQSANLLELQNSSGTVLASVDPSGIAVFGAQTGAQNGYTIRAWSTPANTLNGQILTSLTGASGDSERYRMSIGNTSSYGFLQTYENAIGYTMSLALQPSGGRVHIGGTSPGARLEIDADAATTKGLIVQGASGQSANLQEWQNNSGTILAQIDSAGAANLRSFGIYDYSRSGGNTADYKHHCLFRNIPDTVGNYVEIGELGTNTLWEVEVLAWRASYDGTYGTGYNLIRKKYYLSTQYLSQGIVIPDFVSNQYSTFNDFELELVNDGNGIATRLRLRRTIAVTSALTGFQAMIKIIGAATYPASAGVSEMSGTGTSALSLAYRSVGYNTTRYSYILPPPPAGGSGSGMPLYVYGGGGVGTGSGGTVVISGGGAAGTGDGGSVILQAGAFVTSGSNGKVIVRGLASNTANLQEWQNNAGTVLAYVSSNASVIGTPSNCFIGANDNSGGQIVLYGAAGGYGIGFKTTSLGNEVIRFNSGQLLITIGQGGNNAGLLVNGNLGASGSVASFVNVGNVASKGIVVKGVASQTGNLQEWQNSAGTALAYVNSAGDIVGAGGAISTGAGNGTDGYGESGPVVLVNKWLAYNTGSIYFNIRKLYGTRAFPATYANGDYVEIAKIYRQGFHPITLTIHAAHGAVNGAASKVYVITPDYNFGNWTAAPLSGGKVGDFDFDVELVAPDPYTLAIRVRRHSSSTPTYANIIFTIESHNYNRGGMVELSGTGNSASALPYRSDYQRIGPTVSAPSPVGGSGAGTDLAIYGGSAIGTGAGGSILLQAGAFATSGSNGKVIVRGLASNTANLQEWQNNAGTALAYVTSAGHAYFGNVYVGSGSGTGSNSTGVGAGALFASTTGYGNTAVGVEALAATTTTSEATAVGWRALESGTGGGTAVGIYALRGATGNSNTAIGNYAGQYVGSGTNNVLAGASVGPQAVTSESVFIGAVAGRWQSDASTAHTGGSRSVHIGYRTAGSSVGDFNTIAIGYLALSKGQNTTVIGNTSTVSTDVFGTLTTTLGASTQKGIVVKGASGQSANLQEWQNNAGTALALVDASGNVQTAGSVQITSNTPAAFTADQNNLALTASGFQRLSGTAARNITGIAPPSGSHVDGRMIRLYNVGSFNLTLKHNSTSSTAANRFWNVQAIDIIVGANDYAELIYDGTNNGSGAAGWRVA